MTSHRSTSRIVTVIAVVAGLVLAVAIIWTATRPNADAPPLVPDDVTITVSPPAQ